MLIVHGLYTFKAKRMAFRNDFCLYCNQLRRSQLIRTLDFVHVFWIPLIPLGFRKRWHCTTCGRDPHRHPKTRRPFIWMALFGSALLALMSCLIPVETGQAFIIWAVRVAAILGTAFLIAYLIRVPKDPSMKERMASVPPAADILCPFCGTQMQVLSGTCSCPKCGVVRI